MNKKVEQNQDSEQPPSGLGFTSTDESLGLIESWSQSNLRANLSQAATNPDHQTLGGAAAVESVRAQRTARILAAYIDNDPNPLTNIDNLVNALHLYPMVRMIMENTEQPLADVGESDADIVEFRFEPRPDLSDAALAAVNQLGQPGQVSDQALDALAIVGGMMVIDDDAEYHAAEVWDLNNLPANPTASDWQTLVENRNVYDPRDLDEFLDTAHRQACIVMAARHLEKLTRINQDNLDSPQAMHDVAMGLRFYGPIAELIASNELAAAINGACLQLGLAAQGKQDMLTEADRQLEVAQNASQSLGNVLFALGLDPSDQVHQRGQNEMYSTVNPEALDELNTSLIRLFDGAVVFRTTDYEGKLTRGRARRKGRGSGGAKINRGKRLNDVVGVEFIEEDVESAIERVVDLVTHLQDQGLMLGAVETSGAYMNVASADTAIADHLTDALGAAGVDVDTSDNRLNVETVDPGQFEVIKFGFRMPDIHTGRYIPVEVMVLTEDWQLTQKRIAHHVLFKVYGKEMTDAKRAAEQSLIAIDQNNTRHVAFEQPNPDSPSYDVAHDIVDGLQAAFAENNT